MRAKRKQKESKKKDFSKFIVSLVVILNVLFTIAVLYVFLKTENEPTVLVTAWFAFTTGELWMLSSIKKKKVKENIGSNYSEQEEEQ